MMSELSCAVCSATFSRPEHLKRHSVSHDGNRPHACEFCGSAFNRKDVLRRHEKTCRSRCPSVFDDHSERKRFRPSTDPKMTTDLNASSDTAVLSSDIATHTGEAACQFKYSQLNEPEPIPPATYGSEDHNIPWLEDDPTLFNVLGQIGDDSTSISTPLDISAFDSILFPQLNSDLFTAERLEFMARFTSTRGMRTFADPESFRNRQEMARQAYEMQLKLGRNKEIKSTTEDDIPLPENVAIEPEHDEQVGDDFNLLQSKSSDLVDNFRDVIYHKANSDIITLEWTSDINHLCTEFFQPSRISRFLGYFWCLWYPHCPIVHKPLFDPLLASPELLSVMVIIGACLSPGDNDREDAKMWLDSVEELIFRQVRFRSEQEMFLDQPGQRKEIVQCMQAAYLVCSLQKREGTVDAQARIRRHRHASMVTLVRHIGPWKATHRGLEMTHESSFWWQQFAEEEEFIRTTTFVFLIDAALTILHNSPPRMVVPELKMDVACSEPCFQAESAEECMQLLRAWEDTRPFKNTRLSVVSVVRRICQGPIEESLIQEFACLGTLNLFTTVQAIHSLMFQLHNSLVFESTLAPIQIGLDNWRQIWNARTPEDSDVPDIPENLWKRVGFLRHASEFWQLARVMMGKIITSNRDEASNLEGTEQLSRYDHTDMGEVNGLIMEYRRMNLGVL